MYDIIKIFYTASENQIGNTSEKLQNGRSNVVGNYLFYFKQKV